MPLILQQMGQQKKPLGLAQLATTPKPQLPEQPQIGAWQPSLLERLKLRFAPPPPGGPDRSDQPIRTLGKLGAHYATETLSGLGLRIPDILAKKLSGNDTLAEAVDKLTKLELTPKERQSAQIPKFLAQLHTSAFLLGPLIGRLPDVASKGILGGAGIFGLAGGSEQLADKIIKGKPLSLEEFEKDIAIGALFGAGQVGLQKFARFVSGMKVIAPTQRQIAHKEIDKALKIYKKTGDRKLWDAVRAKYAGLSPEVATKFQVRPLKDFGKHPLATMAKTPAREVMGLARPTPVREKPPEAPVIKPKAEIVRPGEGVISEKVAKVPVEKGLAEKAVAPRKAKEQKPISEIVSELKEAQRLHVEATHKPGYKEERRTGPILDAALSAYRAELPPKGAEIWQMTKRQFEAKMVADRSIIAGLNAIRANLADDLDLTHVPYIPEKEATTHRKEIEKAAQKGKPVPHEVLEEYKSEKWAKEALAQPPAKAVKAKVLTFDEFSAQRGVSATPPSFPSRQRAPGGISKRAKKQAMKQTAQALQEWQTKRDELRAEYKELLATGEIREPTRHERLERTAKGVGEAAEAAKRLLAKPPAKAGPPEKTLGGMPQKPPGLTKAEVEHLGRREQAALRAGQARGYPIGHKLGYRQATEKARTQLMNLRFAQKDRQQLRDEARELVQKFVPKEEQARYLNRVGRATTRVRIQALAQSIEKFVSQYEHRHAVKELDANIKGIKKAYGARGTIAKKMRPEFREQVERLLSSFQIANVTPETNVKRQDLLDIASQVIETSADDTVIHNQAEAFTATLRSQKAKTFALRLLPTESIQQLNNQLSWLRHEQEWAERTIGKDKAESLESIHEKVVAETKTKPKLAVPAKTPFDRALRWPRKFVKVDHSNMETLLDATAGGRDGRYNQWLKNKNTVTAEVYDAINEGVDSQYRKDLETQGLVRAIHQRHNVTEKMYLRWLGHKNSVLSMKGSVILTDNEIMAVYMHIRNAHNLKAMLREGFRRGDEKIRFSLKQTTQLVSKLTNQQKAVCEDVGKEVMDGVNRDAINETSLKIEGYHLAVVDNYWPARRYIVRTILGKKPRGLQSTLEGMGFLKERVGTTKPLALNGFYETLYATNKNVAAYHGMAPAFRDAKAVLNDPRLIEKFEDAGLNRHLETIQEQIKRIEDNSAELDPIERIWGKLVRGLARSVFSINLKLAPRQQISAGLISAYVEPKYMSAMRGVATKKVLDEIKRDSPQLARRIRQHRYDRDIGTAALAHEPYSYFTGKALKRDIPLAGLRYFDTNAIVDLWRVATAEVHGHHPNLNQTDFRRLRKQRAEWLMRHSQPTWHVKDRSLFGSTPKPFTKSLTMFMSQREKLVMMLNNAHEVYQSSDRGVANKATFGRTIGTVAMNIVLIAAYNAAFGALIYRKRRTIKEYLGELVQQTIGMVYFGRYFSEALRLAQAKATGKGWQKVSEQIPPIRMVNASIESMASFMASASMFIDDDPKRHKKWKNELERAVDSAVEAVAMATGLPYAGPRQIYRGLQNWGLAPKEEEKKKTWAD